MVRVKNRCTVEGCIGYVVSHGLCDKHRIRLKRHGHLESTRPKDWGERYNHPLYQIWKWKRRSKPPLCKEWENDFQLFAREVGERPGEGYKLYVVDNDKEVSKDNVEWREPYFKNDSEHRAKRAKYAREHRANNKRFYRDKLLQRNYGITIDDYEKILENQGNKCAICGAGERTVEHKANNGMTSFAVDHCHDTNKIRGILCIDCNRGLGLFKDSPEIMKSAYEYLLNND